MSSTSTIRFSVAPVAITLLTAGAMAERELREKACEEAYQRGFDEASALLSRQILEQRSDLAHLQESTLRALAGQHDALVAQISALVPELALEIARRVLAGIEPDRELLQKIVEETLGEVASGSVDVELRLCPRDVELMSGLEEDFAHKYPGLRIVADAELAPGDCRARSRFGEIDGRLSTKIDNVARTLA
jgi:flagellar assembly protein FliH